MTPSLNTALVWASPYLLEWKVARERLLETVLESPPHVYVGFEYGYSEIALA